MWRCGQVFDNLTSYFSIVLIDSAILLIDSESTLITCPTSQMHGMQHLFSLSYLIKHYESRKSDPQNSDLLSIISPPTKGVIKRCFKGL